MEEIWTTQGQKEYIQRRPFWFDIVLKIERVVTLFSFEKRVTNENISNILNKLQQKNIDLPQSKVLLSNIFKYRN